MNKVNTFHRIASVSLLVMASLNPNVFGQSTNTARPTPPPQVVSPEVQPDRHITFRILAPKAESVKISGGDIPNNGQGTALTKGTNGVWEVTMGPIEAGTFRYTFNVDGLNVVDPRNPAVSESNNNAWSVVNVPGSAYADTTDVPHGAVSQVTYYSKSLQKFRRMQIYTPPGYEAGKGKYPVFYLLHGASDSDHSWNSVGRAGFTLDNLIAAKKAKPMIVVMPAGHTRTMFPPGAPRPTTDEFVTDFNQDILPYVESHYRVIADRQHRAIAGLSMGGNQTLNIAIPHLDQFAYVGVFSSGLFSMFGTGRNPAPATGPSWEEQNLATLDNAKLKSGLKLFWFGTGKDDFLVEASRKTVEMFKKHNFNVVYNETSGAHTWLVWRDYLGQFAPQLFQ